jgi:hypothetical protein
MQWVHIIKLAEHNSAYAEAAKYMHFIYTEEIHCRSLVLTFKFNESESSNEFIRSG